MVLMIGKSGVKGGTLRRSQPVALPTMKRSRIWPSTMNPRKHWGRYEEGGANRIPWVVFAHHEEVQHLAGFTDGEDSLHHDVGQLVRQLLLQLGAQAGASHTPQQLPVVRLGVLPEALQERQRLLLSDLKPLRTRPMLILQAMLTFALHRHDCVEDAGLGARKCACVRPFLCVCVLWGGGGGLPHVYNDSRMQSLIQVPFCLLHELSNQQHGGSGAIPAHAGLHFSI